jgi:SAM-dependent methyltransferase
VIRTAIGDRRYTRNVDRKVVEQLHYDRAYESGTRDTKNGFYEISAGLLRYRSLVFENCAGKRVLEYGCGLGGEAVNLAERGAIVTGIDISEVAVAQARRRASALPAGQATFVKADAEALEFQSGSFDLVCGTGILHHLDLDRALHEVERVLVPGGRAVFYEPVGHNPLLNLYRWLTPGSHTRDEHPLLMHEIRAMSDRFGRSEAHFHDLLSIFSIPFLRFRWGRALLRTFEWMDDRICGTMPVLRAWCGVVVLDLRK